jgi:hypothetical protein
MSGYMLNKPVLAGKETKWYRMLKAIYKANRPLHKKEWFSLAGIEYSDKVTRSIKNSLSFLLDFELRGSKYSYRHWKGLYPDLFKEFQYQNLVHYDPQIKKWKMDRPVYEAFCRRLQIERE